MKKAFLVGLALTVALSTLAGCGGSKTQTADKAEAKFPTKPITLLVPQAAGGGTDAIARALGKAAEGVYGQPITVQNKPGAAGAIGMTEGLNSKPDGYTVTFATMEIVLHPTMGNVQWKVSDFKSVIRINSDYAAVTVPADSPYKTFQEFVQAAKEKPGALKVGAGAPGSIWHLAALGLQDKAGVKFNIVPFPGGAAPAITDLLGGHLDAVTVSAAEVAQHVKAGKVRILAVMAPERLEGFADVPTAKEGGVDVSISTWRGLVVPGNTPDDVVKALHDGFKKAMDDKTFVDFMKTGGFGLGYQSSADFQKFMTEQEQFYVPLLKEAGLAKKG